MDLKNYKILPHPSKAIFKKHKIQIKAVSTAVGCSYSYLCGILSGRHDITPELDTKLTELAGEVETGKDESAQKLGAPNSGRSVRG